MTSDGRQPNQDRILSGLFELLTPSAVTSTEFRRIVTAIPELLTPEVDLIGEVLALSQRTDEAKEQVRRVIALLRGCRESGVDNTLLQERIRIGREQKSARLEVLRRQATEDRRNRSQQFVPKRSNYPSLSKCIRMVQEQFPQQSVPCRVKSVDRPYLEQKFEANLPRFFFRGEPGVYESTVSSLDRLLMRTDLPIEAVEDIVRCTIRVKEKLTSRWNLSPMLADGFLQHYGLPTRFLDVTSDLGVAVSFAADLSVGQLGSLCVVPLELLQNCGQLIDLRHLPFAERPTRQHAFAWTSEQHRDLRSPETVNALGLIWHTFELRQEDVADFGPDPILLDAHSDRAAGTIELAMHSMGKIHDEAAKWIAGRLQPAPFMLVRTNQQGAEDVNCIWVSADEAGIPYEPDDRRKLNYERWSNAFPAIPTKVYGCSFDGRNI
jgi:hypothetical protein